MDRMPSSDSTMRVHFSLNTRLIRRFVSVAKLSASTILSISRMSAKRQYTRYTPITNRKNRLTPRITGENRTTVIICRVIPGDGFSPKRSRIEIRSPSAIRSISRKMISAFRR